MKKFFSLSAIALLAALGLCVGFWTQFGVITSFLSFALLWQTEKYFQAYFSKKKISIWLFWAFFLFAWNVMATWWVRITGALWVISTANTLVMLVPVGIWLVLRKKIASKYESLFFVFLWLSFEFLHHRWQLTWVWLTLGNLFLYQNSWVQWYEYTGVLGGSLWILLTNVLIFNFFQKKTTVNLVWVGLWLLVPIGISYVMLWQYKPEPKGTLEVVLVQPNINPFTEKFSDTPHFIPFKEQTKILLNLSEQFITQKTDLLVFPETAFDENFDERIVPKYDNIKRLDSFQKKYAIPVIFGASTRAFTATKTAPTSQYAENVHAFYEDFNAAYLKKGDTLQFYKKIILVPGVETIPFPEYTIFLKDFISDIGASFFLLGVGKEQTIFHVKNARIAPIICYESMYGEFVGEFVKKGANLLCTLTNDGWLGDTDWQQHHLYLGALRCIETRREMLHCSNMGASAVISAKGEILKEIPYNQRTALRFERVILQNEITFYTLYGDYIGRGSLIGLMIWIILVMLKKLLKNGHTNQKGKLKIC